MSERERWIVYPLIFFALGAAVRDKILQRVEAKEVVCESVRIVDLQNPMDTLAVLSFQRAAANDPSQLADRVGRLQLADSDGNEMCDLKGDVFFRRLQTHLLQITDPQGQPLVTAEVEPVRVPGALTDDAEPVVSYQGVIYLNNKPLGTGVRLAAPELQEEESVNPAP